MVHFRYNVQIEPTTGIGVPHIPDQTSDVFRQYLRSYNDWALVGKLLFTLSTCVPGPGRKLSIAGNFSYIWWLAQIVKLGESV